MRTNNLHVFELLLVLVYKLWALAILCSLFLSLTYLYVCKFKWQPSISVSLDLGLGFGHEFLIPIEGATNVCMYVCVCERARI